jgi:hypothetical protein
MLSFINAKVGLYNQLQALLTSDAADIVQYGLPTDIPAINKRRRVYVLAVPPYTPNPVYTPGSQVRVERFVIPIAVEVEVGTGTNASTGAQIAEQGLATLLSAIDTLHDTDPSLGGVCTYSGFGLAADAVGPIADVQGGGGFLAHCLLELNCEAW